MGEQVGVELTDSQPTCWKAGQRSESEGLNSRGNTEHRNVSGSLIFKNMKHEVEEPTKHKKHEARCEKTQQEKQQVNDKRSSEVIGLRWTLSRKKSKVKHRDNAVEA